MTTKRFFCPNQRRLKHALAAACILQLTCIPRGCTSFVQRHQQQPLLRTIDAISRPSQEQLSTRELLQSCNILYSTTSSDADQSSSVFDMSIWENDENTQQQQRQDTGGSNVGMELWLDLRGTSLTPKTALELWNLEKGAQNNLSDIASAPFVKCLVSSEDAPSRHFDQNIDILIVKEEDDDVSDCNMMPFFQQTIDADQTALSGRILSLQTSASMPVLPDPLPAMDVISNGEWIILDTHNWRKIEDEERLGMILPMMELISSGSSSSSGGIGITCHTKNDLVKAAMFIQTKTNSGSAGGEGINVNTKTLESGIVIPDDDANRISLSGDVLPRFAIIVPYDMGLLQTYCLLSGKDDCLDR